MVGDGDMVARITVSARVAASEGQSRRKEGLRVAVGTLYAAKGGGSDPLVLAA